MPAKCAGGPGLAMLDRSASHLVTAAPDGQPRTLLDKEEQRRNISSCRVMDHEMSEQCCSKQNSVLHLVYYLSSEYPVRVPKRGTEVSGHGKAILCLLHRG